MSKFDVKKILPRYSFVAVVLALLAVAVIAKAAYVMTAQRGFWLAVADRVRDDSVTVKPRRGNILSADGELMASSLPEYSTYMDFRALSDAGNDSVWDADVDSLCAGLHHIFPERSAASFKEHLEKGRAAGKRHWPVVGERIDYNTFMQVKALPVFNLPGKYASGFHYEQNNARQHAYGSLAGRTIGDMYSAKDSARYGLELAYDSILRGTDGIIHRHKVLNKYLSITDVPPVDGADIVTTIDVGIQDLAERSLIAELKRINGRVGVAIVMEVQTGDVKAIVNMERRSDGEYEERMNHAVSDLLEPGSVFKTVSFMVALDDGMIDTTDIVDTGSGTWPMYRRVMRDHNWRNGGYGVLTVPRVLMVSSNIGVSRLIDEHYHSCPERFVEGIYRTGIADDLGLPFQGSSSARIRMPRKDAKGKNYVNWSETALPWMSIGYETQVPPISTLTFYNAIANGGKMVKPRFVKQVVKDGEVIKEYPVEVMREHICKESTLGKIQTMLRKVVSEGLGRRAGSKSFAVSGKTGTAQISQGAAGYKTGTTQYLVSFAGYFPSEAPRYSCIVCIQKSGLPASGGTMSGAVFHNIAEGIMAQSLKLDVNDAADEHSDAVPLVLRGNIGAAGEVLTHLSIPTAVAIDESDKGALWGTARREGDGVTLQQESLAAAGRMPDVRGMGARDAVFLAESAGVRTRISGCGKVTEQSIAPGTAVDGAMVCYLTLR